MTAEESLGHLARQGIRGFFVCAVQLSISAAQSLHLHKFDLHVVRPVNHHAAAGPRLPGRRIHDAIRDELAAAALQLLACGLDVVHIQCEMVDIAGALRARKGAGIGVKRLRKADDLAVALHKEEVVSL